MDTEQKIRGAKNYQAGGHIIQRLTINIYVTKMPRSSPKKEGITTDQK